jgi:hypothetical protein
MQHGYPAACQRDGAPGDGWGEIRYGLSKSVGRRTKRIERSGPERARRAYRPDDGAVCADDLELRAPEAAHEQSVAVDDDVAEITA